MIKQGSEVKIVTNALYNRTLNGKRAIVLKVRTFVRVYLCEEGWIETLLRSEVVPV